jgi:Raf kinase inhibitor-like YbhB/YbcL family protein
MKKLAGLLILIALAGCGSTSTVTGTTGGTGTGTFTVTSTAFTNNGAIPAKYAANGAGGQDASPPLAWSNAPATVKSFAISVIDIDFSNTIHALVINIPTTVTSIPENATAQDLGGATVVAAYNGPFPGSGNTHRYKFTVYALNTATITQTNFADTLAAAEAAAIGSASITASYTQP